MPEVEVKKLPPQAAFMLLCSAAGLEGEEVATPAGLPSEINDSRCHYIWRRIAKAGEWTNQARGFTLKLSQATIDQLGNTQKDMLASGDEVPSVKDHIESSDSTLGYVKGYRVEGPWLCGLFQVIGDKSLETFNKNYLSAAFVPNYTDSAGNHRGLAITHVATTPRPTIGQQELLAASQAAGPILMSQGENMDESMNLPCSQANLDQLHSYVPGLADKPMDGKVAHMVDHFKRNAPRMMSAADIVANAELRGEVLKMSNVALAAPPIPQNVVELLREQTLDHLQTALASGKITEDQRKTAAAMLVGDRGQPATVFMSQAADGSIPAIAQAKFLCSLSPVQMGGVRPVARTVPGGAAAGAEPRPLPYESASTRFPKSVVQAL